MGKIKGFLEYARVNPPQRTVPERITDYNEVCRMLDSTTIRQQAARCMDCGIPFCHSLGCPLYNLIPEWNEYLFRGRWEEALKRLEMTNNFPEITGRVCPAPCEASCTLALNDAAVTIRHNELSIIEHAFAHDMVKPRRGAAPSGKKVVIVGSGPAGLAAAQQLCRLGHMVMVMEKQKQLGGLLRYGIPNFKLEKWVLDRRIAQLQAEGVRFQTDVTVGDDISVRFLRKSFDAVLLACGAELPRDLPVPGRDLGGICFAMDYLACANRHLSGDFISGAHITARGKHVLIIGGGDTGSDCVGTAHRQGAKSVHQIEILPMPPVWDKPWNPEWPDWPAIRRDSSSHTEGCHRQWSILTTGFEGRAGQVCRANCVEVDWYDDNGARHFRERAGSGFSLEADLVLLAMGFTGIQSGRLIKDLGIELTGRNTIGIDARYMTTKPGIFAAGDAAMGPSLVVRSIYQGREAAAAIHSFIKTVEPVGNLEVLTAL